MARTLIETSLKLLIAWFMLCCWGVQGLVVPVVVASHSMMPTLFGPHTLLCCPECQRQFASELISSGQVVRCPRCDFLWQRISPTPVVAADRVLILRSAYFLSPPQRFDLVALRDPVDGLLAVKRVVGLPGERVALDNGEVTIDGNILVKPLKLRRILGVPIEWTSNIGPVRNAGPNSNIAWRNKAGGYQVDSQPLSPPLLFRNVHLQPGEAGIAAPVRDAHPFNQAVSRQTYVVNDLTFRATVWFEGSGSLTLTLPHGKRKFQLQLAPRRSLHARWRELGRTPWQLPTIGRENVGNTRPGSDFFSSGQEVQVELWCCDGRFGACWGGRTILDEPLPKLPSKSIESQPEQSEPVQSNFASGEAMQDRLGADSLLGDALVGITAENLTVRLSQVVLSRDVYYPEPEQPSLGLRATQSVRAGKPSLPHAIELGEQEYYLLGDNPAVSLDSRHWGDQVRVDENLITGKVVTGR